MTTASEVIEMFGGITRLSRISGHAVSAIGNWRQRDKIPPEHFGGLVLLAQETGATLPNGKPLTLEGLHGIEIEQNDTPEVIPTPQPSGK